jgi:hypothetical protein
MSTESKPTDPAGTKSADPEHRDSKRGWGNPTIIAAIIGATATILVALIPILLSRKPSATVEADAADTVQVDTMDSLVSWTAYTDDLGSTLAVSSKPGRTDSAVELLFDLQDGGWVGIARAVGTQSLAGSDGLAFYLRGSGEPNTVELKLLYTLEDGTNPVFSVNWYASTVTADWVRLEASYDQFTCWDETGCNPGDVLDPARVTRIDFAISNKPGDVPGVGVVLLDSVQAIHR